MFTVLQKSRYPIDHSFDSSVGGNRLCFKKSVCVPWIEERVCWPSILEDQTSSIGRIFICDCTPVHAHAHETEIKTE